MQQTPSVPVIVIVGAGASFAAAPDPQPYEPSPLTNDLFAGTRAFELLSRYDLAHKAVRFIQGERGRDNTIKLEAALRELRLSDYAHMRHVALAVPLYLQELLLNVSRELKPYTSRYDTLTFSLSRLPKAIYVSLNYDTLLDHHLHTFAPLTTFKDYINPRRQWALIKPHGSVNWNYRVQPTLGNGMGQFDPYVPPADLQLDTTDMGHVPPNVHDIDSLRLSKHGVVSRYPALAMPEGRKDVLKLPSNHMNFFTAALTQAPEADLLVLGYSAIDTEVLSLIKHTGVRIRRMTIVNRSAEESLAVYDVIQAFGINAVWPDVFDGNYADWIDNTGLNSWVAEFGGPPHSATDPERLRQRLGAPQATGRVVVESGVTRVPSWEELAEENRRHIDW